MAFVVVGVGFVSSRALVLGVLARVMRSEGRS